MPKKDFEDEDKIERDYLPVIHDCLKESLGAEEVCIFDYMVRRREAAFPYQAKSKDSSPQPALSAHIGMFSCEYRSSLARIVSLM